MNIGYARISTQDQKLDLQQHALQTAGCDKIYEDTLSGMKQERQGLNLALEVLRSGDVLVIWKLDRLGRSVKQLINLVGDLEKKGIQFKSLTEGIDTSTAAGRFFFTSWPVSRRWSGKCLLNALKRVWMQPKRREGKAVEKER